MIEQINNLLFGAQEMLYEADVQSVELWNRLSDWQKLGNLVFQGNIHYQTIFNQDRSSAAASLEPGWSRLKWTIQNRIENLNKIKAELS